MTGSLNDLDGSVVACFNADVGREWNLGEAKGAWVRGNGWTGYLEGRNHGQTHVEGSSTHAQVDVDERSLVSWEPSGLEGDGASIDGPFRPVRAGYCAAAWSCRLLVLGRFFDEV